MSWRSRCSNPRSSGHILWSVTVLMLLASCSTSPSAPKADIPSPESSILERPTLIIDSGESGNKTIESRPPDVTKWDEQDRETPPDRLSWPKNTYPKNSSMTIQTSLAPIQVSIMVYKSIGENGLPPDGESVEVPVCGVLSGSKECVIHDGKLSVTGFPPDAKWCVVNAVWEEATGEVPVSRIAIWTLPLKE